MASPAQIAANRSNAMKSTGPRTDEGIAASKMNALKHGIDARSAVIPGEDPAELAALASQYRDRYRPSTPEQVFLVDTLIKADWDRLRYTRLEYEIFDRLRREWTSEDSPASVFMSDTPGSRALERALRYMAAAERAWFRAYKELERLKQAEASAAAWRETMLQKRDGENWLRSVSVVEASPALAPVPSRDRAREENLALRL